MSDDLEVMAPGIPMKHIGDARVSAPMGIATIALSMAMKYHDINTVQDGVLYQQYKMEGKNLSGLHLDDVFETAQKIELYLMAANERVANIMAEAMLDTIQNMPDAEAGTDEPPTPDDEPPASPPGESQDVSAA